MDPTWWAVGLGGLLVGFVVGLTGMGGGALMTPMMILFFKVDPLAAVSSDLVASLVMKPVGGVVHLRRGTVNKDLVKWLCIGSVPSAFLGVLVLRALGNTEATGAVVKTALGIALLFAAGSMVAKALLDMRKAQRLRLELGTEAVEVPVEDVKVKPVPTVLVGIFGGLIVGMTSVGSGSLMIVALLLLYPAIRAGQLVGTDLVQAVPLVASAALGHILFGDFRLGLTSSLLIGAIPGVWIGAHVSSRAPGGVIRRALVVVLTASGLKLLGASNQTLFLVLLAVAIVGPILWATIYRRARPDKVDTPPSQLMGAAVTGRWLRRSRAGQPEVEAVGSEVAATPEAATADLDGQGRTAQDRT